MEWYFTQNGNRQGPVDIEALKKLTREGKLLQTDHVWNKSMGEKWSPVSAVPILADPMKATEDPRANADFKKRLEEQTVALKRKKAADNIRIVATLVIIVSLIGGVVFWIKSKPRREIGMSSSTILGQLEKFGEKLKSEELQFQEKPVERCAYVVKQGAKMLIYSDPKGERGKHVSAKGNITLLADEDGTIHGVLATFPSPGTHGPHMIDQSLTSVFIRKYWCLVGGTEEKAFDGERNMPKDLDEIHGMVNMPGGSFARLETDKVRGLWLMWGSDLIRTMVYIRVK